MLGWAARKAGCGLMGFICLLQDTEVGRKWFSTTLRSLPAGTVVWDPGQWPQLCVLLLETFLFIQRPPPPASCPHKNPLKD